MIVGLHRVQWLVHAWPVFACWHAAAAVCTFIELRVCVCLCDINVSLAMPNVQHETKGEFHASEHIQSVS